MFKVDNILWFQIEAFKQYCIVFRICFLRIVFECKNFIWHVIKAEFLNLFVIGTC